MDSLRQKMVETLHLGEKEEVEMGNIHSPEASLVETLPVGERENVEMGSIHSAETAPRAAASLPREGLPIWHEMEMKAVNEAIASSSTPLPMVVCSDDHPSEAFECVKCLLVFTTLDAFKRHFEGSDFHHPCSHCGREFHDTKKFRDHIKLVLIHEPLSLCRAPASPAPVVAPQVVSPGSKRSRAQVESEPGEDQLARDSKQARLNRESRLKKAAAKVQTQTNFLLALRIVVLCPLCPEFFSSLREVKLHLEETPHYGYYTFKCVMCWKTFCVRVDLLGLKVSCPGCRFISPVSGI